MTNAARRNAMSAALLGELEEALQAAESAGCRALVFRAEPGVSTWSAGYDIAELPTDGSDPLTWTNPLEGFLHAVRRAPFPVIAAVEGGVWGGACEFVLTCDLIVAEDGGNLEIVILKADGTAGVVARRAGDVGSELTGVAFSPDGSRLYFSSQRSPGTTLEVTGPFI